VNNTTYINGPDVLQQILIIEVRKFNRDEKNTEAVVRLEAGSVDFRTKHRFISICSLQEFKVQMLRQLHPNANLSILVQDDQTAVWSALSPLALIVT
jgi:hypothetical protein